MLNREDVTVIVFKLAKSSAIKSRTQAIDQLKAAQARVDGNRC
ncbi:hypothetical protein [Salinispora oceanensis]|nr:hypothetical protein [Salinispora oceanensis]